MLAEPPQKLRGRILGKPLPGAKWDYRARKGTIAASCAARIIAASNLVSFARQMNRTVPIAWSDPGVLRNHARENVDHPIVGRTFT
jgi:hypothetical protein